MYESTKDEIKKKKKKKKIEQKKWPSCATYDVENKLRGLTNIINQSEIPYRFVAFEIITKRANKSRKIDPLKVH